MHVQKAHKTAQVPYIERHKEGEEKSKNIFWVLLMAGRRGPGILGPKPGF
jgi:hypothetical protein